MLSLQSTGKKLQYAQLGIVLLIRKQFQDLRFHSQFFFVVFMVLKKARQTEKIIKRHIHGRDLSSRNSMWMLRKTKKTNKTTTRPTRDTHCTQDTQSTSTSTSTSSLINLHLSLESSNASYFTSYMHCHTTSSWQSMFSQCQINIISKSRSNSFEK